MTCGGDQRRLESPARLFAGGACLPGVAVGAAAGVGSLSDAPAFFSRDASFSLRN